MSDRDADVEHARVGAIGDGDDCAPGLHARRNSEGGEDRRGEECGAEEPGAQVSGMVAIHVPRRTR